MLEFQKERSESLLNLYMAEKIENNNNNNNDKDDNKNNSVNTNNTLSDNINNTLSENVKIFLNIGQFYKYIKHKYNILILNQLKMIMNESKKLEAAKSHLRFLLDCKDYDLRGHRTNKRCQVIGTMVPH